MDAEHVDVVVVGAGLSGIGAAYRLQTMCPDRSFLLLEGRETLGGTWDLFRYPGIRSDSDMHTLGYPFKPWTHEQSIAGGPAILSYLRETAEEYGIDRHIRYRTHVDAASWSSDQARWTIRARRTDTGEPVVYTCSFLFMCAGYYSYRGGYRPEIAGLSDFAGVVVHPQEWPSDLDYRGKRVAVIGSGATAMTLVPAMANDAAHVTMIQRSPTYVVSLPDRDVIANTLNKVLPVRVAASITRRKNLALGQFFYRQTRTKPDKAKRRLLKMVRKELGDAVTAEHFTPTYGPWDQRLCLIPNGDLYKAITSGNASVVTGTIETVTPTGVRMASGGQIDADVLITATGLNLVTFGEMDFEVDGTPVDFAEVYTYRGVGFSDVPNMAATFGYINASWTLRSDMIAQYVCRLLNHLREAGAEIAVPRLRDSDRSMPYRPYIDDFSAGYIQRMAAMLPKQGDRAPWLNLQRYHPDRQLLEQDFDDGVMQFERRASKVAAR